MEQNYSTSESDHLQVLIETYAKYNKRLDFDKFQVDQPVIGILTMPTFERMKSNTFTYPHFVWEDNVNFIHYAGNWAVPIRYDISDEDLYQLLD